MGFESTILLYFHLTKCSCSSSAYQQSWAWGGKRFRFGGEKFGEQADQREFREFEIYVADDGTNPGARTVTSTLTVNILDANDVRPVFSPAVYSSTVVEPGVAGTTVTTVTATDSDDAILTYSLATATVFSIDSGGVITLANSNTLDYETTKQYALVAYAADAAGNSATTTVHIRVTGVNEHTPVFAPASRSVTIDENASLGTLVVDADATDQDHGADGTLTYTLTSVPAGFTNLMAINPATGEMTVAGDIDRESMATSPVIFIIGVTDSGTAPGNSVI